MCMFSNRWHLRSFYRKLSDLPNFFDNFPNRHCLHACALFTTLPHSLDKDLLLKIDGCDELEEWGWQGKMDSCLWTTPEPPTTAVHNNSARKKQTGMQGKNYFRIFDQMFCLNLSFQLSTPKQMISDLCMKSFLLKALALAKITRKNSLTQKKN